MRERRVAVTGAGVVSPLGSTLEDFHRAHNAAMWVAYRNHTYFDTDAVSQLVMKVDFSLLRAPAANALRQRTFTVAKEFPELVTVHEDLVAAEASDDLMPHVAGDPLGRLVPKNNSPLAIGDIDTNGKVVYHIAERLWAFIQPHGRTLIQYRQEEAERE